MHRHQSRHVPVPPTAPTPARPGSEVSLPPLPEPAPHLLRVLEGAVIDFPAPVLHPDARRWAATCWPDPTQPGGWGRAIWWPSPYHRGWLPVALDYADVVEFGADIPIRHGRRWVPVRWYGIVIQRSTRQLIVYGPVSTPLMASAVAEDLKAAIAHHEAWPMQR
jgi:hypothetical protein